MITHTCVSHLTNCMRPIVCLHPTCIQCPTHQPVLHCFVIAVCSCWCHDVKLYWWWTFFWWSYQSLSVVVSQSYSIGTWYICLSCKISVYQVLSGLTIVCHVPTHSLRDKLYYPVLRREKNTCVYTLYSWVFKKLWHLRSDDIFILCMILPAFLVGVWRVSYSCSVHLSFNFIPSAADRQEERTISHVHFP